MIKNLFVVGAAKSGTTSLHRYLNEHEDICMSCPKEPKYFSYIAGVSSFRGPGDAQVLEKVIKTRQEYDSICVPSADDVLLGESSADYLYYSSIVVPYIEKYNRDAKIIIMLRNPVDRAFSAFSHLKRDGREHLSMSEALLEEENRIAQGWEFIWHYKKAGLYYEDVRRFMEVFPSVKVILFDEFVNNLDGVMDDVFDFLEVKRIKVKNVTHNKSGAVRFHSINRIIKSQNLPALVLKRILAVFVSDKQKRSIASYIKNWNLKRDTELNQHEEVGLLKAYYRNDIEKLEGLLGCDLSAWK